MNKQLIIIVSVLGLVLVGLLVWMGLKNLDKAKEAQELASINKSVALKEGEIKAEKEKEAAQQQWDNDRYEYYNSQYDL